MGWMKVGIISLKELEYRLDSGAPMRLIDLRKPEEYDVGHLEGAANIPFDQIRERIAELEGDTATVFYCSRGGNSLLAARMAAGSGIPAYSVANGIIYYRGRHMVRN